MDKFIELNTEVGVLKGRDAIFLDKIVFDRETKVRLVGELNSDKGDKNFEITFEGIVYFSAVEFDFDEREQMESFGIISDSKKLKDIRSRDHSRKTNNGHRHYYIRTYDSVFEIICAKYELTIKT
jgi:hypothetical protein